MLLLDLLGWKQVNLRTEGQLLLFNHKSNWDYLILLLYLFSWKTKYIIIANPSENPIIKRLLRRLHFIHEIPDTFENSHEFSDVKLFVIPYLSNDTSYYYLAYKLNLPVMPLMIDYRGNCIQTGNVIQVESANSRHLIEQTSLRIEEIFISGNFGFPGIPFVVSFTRLIDLLCFFIIAMIWSEFFLLVVIFISVILLKRTWNGLGGM